MENLNINLTHEELNTILRMRNESSKLSPESALENQLENLPIEVKNEISNASSIRFLGFKVKSMLLNLTTSYIINLNK